MKKIPALLAGAAVLLCSLTVGAAVTPLPEGAKEVTTPELKAMFDQKEQFMLINSLSALEFSQTKIQGSVNIPYSHLRDGLVKLPADKSTKLVFYCLGPA